MSIFGDAIDAKVLATTQQQLNDLRASQVGTSLAQQQAILGNPQWPKVPLPEMTQTEPRSISISEQVKRKLLAQKDLVSVDTTKLEALRWLDEQLETNPEFAKTLEALRSLGVL